MTIGKNEKCIIRALAENKVHEARRYARFALENDKAEGNRDFREDCLPKLKAIEEGPVELPHRYRGLLVLEEPSKTFCERRYYLSDREASLFEHIARMREVGSKLAQMDIGYRNSTIMYGGSGTGKTMFGRYVAYRFGLPFVYVNFSGLVDSYLGATAKNIARAFEYVQTEPCVFMLDELDCIGEARATSDSGSGKEMNRTAITIMQELDGLTNDHVVLAATNRLDAVDDAILRRFSKKHEMLAFDASEKRQMVLKLLEDVGVWYERDDVQDYCRDHEGPQSECITDAIESIAKSLRDGTPFRMRAGSEKAADR